MKSRVDKGAYTFETPKAVLRLCKKAEWHDDLHLKPDLEGKEVRWQLQNDASTRSATAGNIKYDVTPLGVADCYIAINVSFDAELRKPRKDKRDVVESSDFKSASIVVFYDGGAELLPILRAEWDWYPEQVNNPHAQPHWHTYTIDPSMGNPQKGESFENVNELPEIIPNAVDSGLGQIGEPETHSMPIFDRVHLAMCASWPTDPSVHGCDRPSELEIGQWMEGCINYIKNQLVYWNRRQRSS